MNKIHKNISLLSILILYFYNTLVADYQIVNIKQLNTKEDDFAPSINFNENFIYYNWSDKERLKLFKRKINSQGKFDIHNTGNLFSSNAIEVIDEIVKTKINPTYISFWGNEAYLTGKVKSPKGSLLGIYLSNYEKNNWQLIRLLEELGIDKFNVHPTISPSGNILVYSTATPNKPEESDLMIAYKDEKNNWSSVVPLNNLNSNLSEITPFFASDDTLYFASNGLDGRGGYDIFYSIFENGDWQKPIPVEGINTESDESDFIKLCDDTYLFVSNRTGGMGGLDIWAYSKQNIDEYIDEPELKISLNTSALKIQRFSSFIQVVNNANLIENFFKNNFTKEKDYYYIFSDSIISNPSHIEVNYNYNKNLSNYSITLEIKNNNQIIYSKDLMSEEKKIIIPVQNLFDQISIPDKIELTTTLKKRDIEKVMINEIDIFKSQKEIAEIFEIDNIKFKMIIIPLPEILNNDVLEKSLNFLKKEVKYKNSKIIIESSPTFELYDNEKIRAFLSSLNINNNAIIYQKKIVKNLSKYFNNLSFNYLIIYLQI